MNITTVFKKEIRFRHSTCLRTTNKDDDHIFKLGSSFEKLGVIEVMPLGAYASVSRIPAGITTLLAPNGETTGAERLDLTDFVHRKLAAPHLVNTSSI